MPWSHPEETKAQARRLVETTPKTYAEIGAALGGVPVPTVGAWKRRYGWTRPPDAIRRTPIPKEKRRIGVRCATPAWPITRSLSISDAILKPRAGSDARRTRAGRRPRSPRSRRARWRRWRRRSPEA